jgi:hypothetical protein
MNVDFASPESAFIRSETLRYLKRLSWHQTPWGQSSLMKFKLKYIFYPALLLSMLYFSSDCISQKLGNAEMNSAWGDWQITLRVGAQMSGIKNEDFVAANFSPLLNISFGKWFSPVLALQIGYKGWYFNTIADEKKHNYGYYYGEAVLNANRLSRHYRESCKWSLYLHCGSGYFYNYDYNRPNICADMGITNNYRLTDHLQACLDVSAIAGWDIYQGDADILPGLSVGIAYLF